MKLFKKLDNYLLHYYPSIWITRVHYFLPIGLAIFVLLFFSNLAIGWNPKSELPDASIAVVLMIIPVLLYLVYWFIFQSRYNVLKSGGKMKVGFEYLNYFIYLLVFFMAFLIICAIPISNHAKLKYGVDRAELLKDIDNLNAGNTLVNSTNRVEVLTSGTIRFIPSNFVYNDYYYDEYYYDDYYETTEANYSDWTSVTRNEALIIIKEYIRSYNKYSKYPITNSAQNILKEHEGFYDTDIPDDYYVDDYYYYDDEWEIQYKLGELERRITTDEWYGEFQEPWFWKIAIGIMAFLALLVWQFKQMKLRHFVFGFISICLTPLLMAIIGVIVFELLGYRGAEEIIVSFIALFAYAVIGFFAFRGYLSKTLNNTGYVLMMYFQFVLPLLPLFLWLFFGFKRYDYYYWGDRGEFMLNFIYYFGWVVGLASIIALKPVYTKFRSLPARS